MTRDAAFDRRDRHSRRAHDGCAAAAPRVHLRPHRRLGRRPAHRHGHRHGHLHRRRRQHRHRRPTPTPPTTSAPRRRPYVEKSSASTAARPSLDADAATGPTLLDGFDDPRLPLRRHQHRQRRARRHPWSATRSADACRPACASGDDGLPKRRARGDLEFELRRRPGRHRRRPAVDNTGSARADLPLGDRRAGQRGRVRHRRRRRYFVPPAP